MSASRCCCIKLFEDQEREAVGLRSAKGCTTEKGRCVCEGVGSQKLSLPSQRIIEQREKKMMINTPLLRRKWDEKKNEKHVGISEMGNRNPRRSMVFYFPCIGWGELIANGDESLLSRKLDFLGRLKQVNGTFY